MKTLPNMIVFALMLGLFGCGQSSDEIDIDYSELEMSLIKDAPLEASSTFQLGNYIKNGIRLRLSQQGYPEMLAVDTLGNGATISNFSTTNVHEIGVDEADRFKYDGEYLYQVNRRWYQNGGQENDNSINILKTDFNNATTREVSKILNNSDDLNISDIYLRAEENQLISIKNTQYLFWGAVLSDSDWNWGSGKTEIQLFDVQIPENPSEQWKIEIEGNLEGSRRIGNMLYLVTRYIPNIPEIDYAANTVDTKKENEKLILNTPISDLLPHFQTNDGAIRSLVNAENCLVAEATSTNEGYADLITLSAINLDTKQVTDSICLNVNVSGIYSSITGFYIGGSSYSSWLEFSSFTAVHKFELNNGSINYRASATLPGFLGWNDPSFRMSEYQDDLRIVTSRFDSTNGELKHQLTVLREDGSHKLEEISQLPNNSNPTPIGKPGEDIFAVRFAGERAYIVTFERVDPLYILDLSNPELPNIAGELEIPGFSRYLHALSDDWLLGIGNDVADGQIKGVKLELYDIRDISNPLIKNTYIFGGQGSNTEANFDLRAISLLTLNEDQARLALPINIWQKDDSESYNRWLESGLFLFELNTDTLGELSLDFSGKMLAESRKESLLYPTSSGASRSKLHNDAIFYLHGNQIYSTLWGEWDSLNEAY